MMKIEYSKPVVDIIKNRSSRRTYKDIPLDHHKRGALLDVCSRLDTGLFGEKVVFNYVEKVNQSGKDLKLGDYGMFKNARYFLVGKTAGSKHACESYGYLLEQFVLKACDLGLGTCWMGVFNRPYFNEIIVQDNEIIPAICIFGEADDRRLIEKTARFAVGAAKRKPWSDLFFDGGFGVELSLETAGVYAAALEMIRLAPSSGNSQPWRVVKEGEQGKFHFYLKRVKQDYYERKLHFVDVGIAMCHFALTLKETGLAGKWIENDPGLPQMPPDTEYLTTWIRVGA